MENQNGLWTQVNVRCSGRGDGVRERSPVRIPAGAKCAKIVKKMLQP